MEQLWRNELDWVALTDTEEESPQLFRDAARRLDIFLDYLLAQASGTTAHLLDHRFDGVLSDPERTLRGALEDFLAAVPPQALSTPAWAQVDALIRQLGGIPIPTAYWRHKNR